MQAKGHNRAVLVLCCWHEIDRHKSAASASLFSCAVPRLPHTAALLK